MNTILIEEIKSFTHLNENGSINIESTLANFSEWQTKFYQQLSEDIICGNYLIDGKYIKSLNNIIELLESFFSTLMIENLGDNIGEEDQDIDVIDFTNYDSSIKSCIRRLKILIDQIDKRNKSEIHKPLFILKEEYEIFMYDQFSQDINSLLIPLEYHDHFLVVDNSILNDLARISSKINSSSFTEEVKELISIKCHFLIKKILRRLNEDDVFSYRYIDNYNDKDLAEYLEPIKQCSKLDGLVESNYKDDYDTSQKYRNKRNPPVILKSFQKNDQRLNFSDYQELSKYFKDQSGDRISLEKLFESIKNIDTQTYDSRSIYAHNVSAQYILNNILSFDKENNPTKLARTYYDACVLQEAYEIKNYFPHLYFAQFIKNEVNKKIDLEIINIDELQEALSEFDKILKEAYLTYKWCSDRDFQSFMCPTNECIYEVELKSGKKKNIFIGSSYVLPNNYDKVKLELDQLTNELEKYKTSLEIYKKNKLLNEKIQNTENTLNRAEKKNIEILSIFAAIVLFVTGEVQMFQFITETNQAIYFTLSFAYSLALFSVLIWLITRDNNIKESWFSSRSIIVGVLICATITSFYYLSNTELPTQPKIEQYEKAIQKIDSLEVVLKNQKDILDALKKK